MELGKEMLTPELDAVEAVPRQRENWLQVGSKISRDAFCCYSICIAARCRSQEVGYLWRSEKSARENKLSSFQFNERTGIKERLFKTTKRGNKTSTETERSGRDTTSKKKSLEKDLSSPGTVHDLVHEGTAER
ncbi:hypothetical protein VTN00DRAFT_6356 [Thermoascus crustaceus]|uniref:uncharacterized protein n=1 Tax=Thermoascus crustaceus TaxID=5088 RepID=UPI0037446F52